MALEKLNSHMQKDKNGPWSYTIYKNLLKIKNLSVRHETKKFLEEIQMVTSLTFVLVMVMQIWLQR